MKKFEVQKNKNINHDAINRWFKKCENEHIPYIVIKTKNKYAQIDWDYISFPKGYDKILINEKEKIYEFVMEIKNKYGVKKSDVTGNTLVTTFINIPLENAEKLATELFDFLNNLVNG